jgi:hypothetical protein
MGVGGGGGMGVGGGGGLAMSAAMAGMPIAAANKAAVMAFFIISLRQFALTIPDFIISPYLQGCTKATQTGDIAGWLTGSTLLRVSSRPRAFRQSDISHCATDSHRLHRAHS